MLSSYFAYERMFWSKNRKVSQCYSYVLSCNVIMEIRIKMKNTFILFKKQYELKNINTRKRHDIKFYK